MRSEVKRMSMRPSCETSLLPSCATSMLTTANQTPFFTPRGSHVSLEIKPSNKLTIRLCEALDNGMKTSELFAHVRDLLNQVGMITVPTWDDETKVIRDKSLWRFSKKGVHVRYDEDEE